MALTPADHATLDALIRHLDEQAGRFVGYPCNDRIDYQPLYALLRHSVNNVGDPFGASTYRLNTHAIEREVVRFFAELYHLPAQEAWGYVSHGGTEGNMYGLYLARERFPTGLVYYSADTHYSVQKILRLLGARSIMIRSTASGALDLEDLEVNLRLHRDAPAIVFANIGTTMTGAVDDLAGINRLLRQECIRDFHIHCDAALAGMILPFVDDPPPFDFRHGVDSLAVSGHKMIGSPMPCGVVLTRRRHVDRIERRIEYVGSSDTTLAGSRNGITPVFLWHALRSHGTAGLRELVTGCLDTAVFCQRRLVELGLHAWRNPHSITVVFDRPSAVVLERWSIAVQGDIAHVITMPHVTREHVDLLADELRAPATPPTA